MGIAGIIYILLSIIFLTVFARTLQSIFLQKRLSAAQQNDASDHQFDIVEVEIHEKIQKYLGLSFIGLIVSVISLLFKALVILFDDFEFGIQIVAWVNSIDSFVNFLVLFFQYGFAAKQYYYWCKCIDKSFKKCMDRKAETVIIGHEYTQTDADDSLEEEEQKENDSEVLI